MSKGNTYESDILALLFTATAIANVADNTATSPLTNLYVSAHTADPGETGNQQTSECAYGAYARVAVARPAGWTVTGSSVSPAANIDFPACTSGTETISWGMIGSVVSATGKQFYRGTVTPNIAVSAGVTPRFTTASTVTED